MERNAEFELRRLRNIFLLESDWTQFSDSPLTDEQKNLWSIYRQELRDLPENSNPSFDTNGTLIGYTLPSKPE